MASHPYELFRDNSASSLGRSRTLNGILSRLAAHHLSVTGLRYFGKTMLLRVVEQTAKSGSVFAHVVYWDLRHRTPDCDESFFNAFAECLACEIGDGEVREFLKDGTFTSIKGVFDYLKVNGERVLLIMDGMDQPLGSENLSPNVWDNLCALAANPSISIVTGSRKRLRQLCANPSSRTSDFWERFHDPVVELHAFTEDELHEFLAPLSELRALDRGCEREFMNWTGGVPVLSVALAARLAEGSKGPDRKSVV